MAKLFRKQARRSSKSYIERKENRVTSYGWEEKVREMLGHNLTLNK